jgi:hypothetical protein
MKVMPSSIKQKLRRIYSLANKISVLTHQVEEEFELYGVDSDFLRANGDVYTTAIQTEALTYIDYGEGDLEQNIAQVEEVFLYYVNRTSVSKE